MERLIHIAQQFDVKLEPDRILPVRGGHINSTFRIENRNKGIGDVLLQQINIDVFKDPVGLMQNLVSVTAHIQQKKEYEELVARVIPTKKGEYWVADKGEVWRMSEFVANKQSYETAVSREICKKAGQSYGSFLAALADFPVKKLNTPIPDFHNIRYRLYQLEQALANPHMKRNVEAKPQINEIKVRSADMCGLYDEAISGELPLRVTHNDAKLSNVLIGNTALGTVIDLDTVMPGFVFFDVGDALRSMAISAKEDETDMAKIELLGNQKDAFLEGYFLATNEIITDNERKSLELAGAYMAYIMAVRFLTDYINGDLYYRVSHPMHNLERAKNQLKACSLFW